MRMVLMLFLTLAFHASAKDQGPLLHLDTKGPLFLAQEFFLQNKMPEMVSEIQKVLKQAPSDKVILGSVYKMLEATYEKGAIRVGWETDPLLSHVAVLLQSRSMGDGHGQKEFLFEASLHARPEDLKIRVRNDVNGQTILTHPSPDCHVTEIPGNELARLRCQVGVANLSPGLYELEVSEKQRGSLKQWVILTPGDVEFPDVKVHSIKSSSQPEFHWELRGAAADGSDLSVAVLGQDGARPVWSLIRRGEQARAERARVGHEPDQKGVSHLQAGGYVVDISYYRLRRFGAIDVVRSLRVSRPFEVRP